VSLRTEYRTCPFCEATCGLELTLDGDTVTRVKGDDDDVLSHGFICPKATGIKALPEDPDRIRTPLVRDANGDLQPASWDEALAAIDAGLAPILAEDRNAVAAYLGNPNAHNLDAMVYSRVLLKALGTKNIYSASTVDQMPKQVSAGLMFGTILSVPVPDMDRCEHLLILGANPLASNGSLLTSPDMRGRIRAIIERGGKVVVIDPRRSRTAEEASEHHFIRPGTDALLLFGMAHTLLTEDLASPGTLAGHVEGLDRLASLVEPFSPEAVGPVCGIEAGEIRRLARELAGAKRAAVYGRIGTCTQEFGTLASWLVDVLNVLTGNLDREGGAMFTRAAAGSPIGLDSPDGVGRGVRLGRWASRVRGLGEAYGELPVACLAEEIDTPGEGRIRALITLAGNPALSTPNSGRLEQALDSLDFMVSLDIYVNETTRHADVVLPAPSPLQRAHYDLALYQLAVRNVANYSPALVELGDGEQAEWVTLLRLAGIAAGRGPHADWAALDDLVAFELARRETASPISPVSGRDPAELLAAVGDRAGPQRALDIMLRCGPYGEGFGADPDGLTLARLEESPHGIDLGPLEPRLPGVLRTPSGKVELVPEPIAGDVPRLHDALARGPANGEVVLIGRRQLRSNNSWMHNLAPLVKGKDRCTMHVHPDDAARFELVEGGRAVVTSAAGSIEVPVEVTDAVMRGVVSIPHGWGHDVEGVELSVASEHAGSNSNLLADETRVDPLSGNAVLNGIPVELAPVRAAEPAPA
jgi:anaerobic selenocysteine-containing dehydrogenase